MLTLHDVQKNIKETSSMTTERFLSLDQFTVFINPPEMHRNILYASVYEDGRLCLNSRLAEKLSGKPVRVRFTQNRLSHFQRMGLRSSRMLPVFLKSAGNHFLPNMKSITAAKDIFGKGITSKSLFHHSCESETV